MEACQAVSFQRALPAAKPRRIVPALSFVNRGCQENEGVTLASFNEVRTLLAVNLSLQTIPAKNLRNVS